MIHHWERGVIVATTLLITSLAFRVTTEETTAIQEEATPIHETTYGRSGFRLEWRPGPNEMQDDAQRRAHEKRLAEAGFQARWLSVVDPLGSPLYPSAVIPSPHPNAPQNEVILRKWVEDIHAQGLPAISWYPLIFSQSGWQAHPDWRQASLLPFPQGHAKEICCCINSGYGDALIQLACEMIERFKLDGIWFDGSAFTQIWDRPLPLTCMCESCQERFRKDTGLQLPKQVDWNDATFRRWIAWRYQVFGGYIGKLAKEIRRRHPKAVVVINYYHRPQIPWHSAIPLDLYDADIVSGSEASGEETTDLTMRLCRAYGRTQSEVWRYFSVADRPEDAPETNDLLHHALTCFTAGGIPSYGLPGMDTEKAAATARLISPTINALRRFAGGDSLNHVALHVSQQSETFYFGRAVDGSGWAMEPYFGSLLRWTSALMKSHLPPDYVYDKAFTPQTLSRYRVLLLPLSPALSQEQAQTVLDFVRKGGIVFLGPACGETDEWGERRKVNPLGKELGFTFTSIYPPAADAFASLPLKTSDGESMTLTTGLHAQMQLRGKEWQVLSQHADSNAPAPFVVRHGTQWSAVSALAMRRFGRGNVFIADIDLASSQLLWQPVAGGDTRIAATDAHAVGGRQCLEFVDGRNAPYVFCPDMEMRFRPFALPDFVGGRMSFDLMLNGAAAQIETRSSNMPHNGALVHVTHDGRLQAGGGELAQLPQEKWLHFEMNFRFATKERGAEFDLTVTTPDGTQRWERLPCEEKNWTCCDWAVIFGPGATAGRFFVDNLRIEGVRADGQKELRLSEDTEGLQVGDVKPKDLVTALVAHLKRLAPPPIEVEAPDTIRFGAFEQDGKIVLHLHNLNGSWRDWGKQTGESVRLTIRLPVSRASLPLREGKELKITRQGKITQIVVPNVGLQEVVVWER